LVDPLAPGDEAVLTFQSTCEECVEASTTLPICTQTWDDTRFRVPFQGGVDANGAIDPVENSFARRMRRGEVQPHGMGLAFPPLQLEQITALSWEQPNREFLPVGFNRLGELLPESRNGHGHAQFGSRDMHDGFRAKPLGCPETRADAISLSGTRQVPRAAHVVAAGPTRAAA